MGLCDESYPWSLPRGNDAHPAKPRTDPIPQGVDGIEVAAEITSSVGLESFTDSCDVVYLDMLINSAEQDYTNSEFQKSLDKLVWIVGLATADAARPEFLPRLAKSNAMMRQLGLGLDFWGEAKNSISLQAVEHYQNLFDLLIGAGDNIEKSYIEFSIASDKEDEKRRAFRNVESSLQSAINASKQEMEQIGVAQKEISSAIDRIAKERNEVWYQLLDSEREFKEAVSRMGPGCDFGQIITIAASVATVVSTGGTGLAAVQTAWSLLNKKKVPYSDAKDAKIVGDDWEGFKFKVNSLHDAYGGVDEFLSSVQSFGNAFDPPTQTGREISPLPSDQDKILASADTIHKMLDQFKDLPEATAYRSVLDRFITTSEARNNKILEYNNTNTRWRDLNAGVLQTEDQIYRSQSEMAAGSPVGLVGFDNLLKASWLRIRKDLVRVIADLNKAINYYSLSNADVRQRIDSTSMTSLRISYVDSVRRLETSRRNFGVPRSTIDGRTLDIWPRLSEEAKRLARSGEIFSFSVDLDEPSFGHLSHVLVQKMGVKIADISGKRPGEYYGAIMHEGLSLMHDTDGAVHAFSHLPVGAPFGYQDSREVDQARFGGENYEGVSLCGTWSMRVETSDGFDLSSLGKIELLVWGTARLRM